MTSMYGPALLTLATVILLGAAAALVGKARAMYKIAPPATTGNEAFERYYRAHVNTVENAVMFLPSLWLAALYASAAWATIAGLVWIAARVWYLFAYISATEKRSAPFTAALIANGALLLMTLFGILRAWI